jgi:hypothetical protein
MGNVVLQLSACSGQQPTTAVVYLLTGAYTITYSASDTNGTFTPTNFWLLGEVLSDPIGAYKTDTANAPTSGSANSAGSGYTYGGSSSSNSSSGSPPKYY